MNAPIALRSVSTQCLMSTYAGLASAQNAFEHPGQPSELSSMALVGQQVAGIKGHHPAKMPYKVASSSELPAKMHTKHSTVGMSDFVRNIVSLDQIYIAGPGKHQPQGGMYYIIIRINTETPHRTIQKS